MNKFFSRILFQFFFFFILIENQYPSSKDPFRFLISHWTCLLNKVTLIKISLILQILRCLFPRYIFLKFSNFTFRISIHSSYLQHYIYSLALVSLENGRSINDKSGGQTDCEINSPPPLSTDRLTEETKAPWGHHRHIKRWWRMAGSRANLQLSSPGAIEEISLTRIASNGVL